MQNYMWLASIFGPFLLILGIWGLFYRDNMLKVYASIKANPGIIYVLGIFNLWIGLVTVTFYNVWALDLAILVTVLGWALVLHGIACLFLPQLVLKSKMRKSKNLSIRSSVFLVWGLVLCWLAFWMQ